MSERYRIRVTKGRFTLHDSNDKSRAGPFTHSAAIFDGICKFALSTSPGNNMIEQKTEIDAGLAHTSDCDVNKPRRHRPIRGRMRTHIPFSVIISYHRK